MSARTPIPDEIIASVPGIAKHVIEHGGEINWQEIAETLGAEVTRLHNEIDRLHKGPIGDPPKPTGRVDRGHPLAALWFEYGLDRPDQYATAWSMVHDDLCPVCTGSLEPGPYAPFNGQCADCNLCWIATDAYLAMDQIDRAIDRGPDE